ncbi:mechanosensitive ion channel domain-containing protein [Falsiroseomonas ponticola]|uniref:mechanosensitive ion channel domain-containing protein n=1 Tax=Falsiroseomonas ponticola TaxID=2786951 RepID=UPI00193317B0|nr:mechanosensitive ion channel family protein [Roseomonas ponticola]
MIPDPILPCGPLALLGLVAARLLLRGRPLARLLAEGAVLAALTLALLVQGVAPHGTEVPEAAPLRHLALSLARIAWWIGVALVAVGLVRAFLLPDRRPRDARLIQDLVIGMVYLGTLLAIVTNVFGVLLGPVIATSGVLAIILGLAMQSTMGDVFSGLALNLSRPYGVGDWIVLDDRIEGRVVETNWRETRLISSRNNLVVVPNSTLAKSTLTNLSSPEPSRDVSIAVRFALTTSPAAILEVMQAVLASANAILPLPPPTARARAIEANRLEVELTFRVRDLHTAGIARSEVLDLVYRHAKAEGLRLAAPDEAGPAPGPDPRPDLRPDPRPPGLRLLDAVPLFASLTAEEKAALAATMTLHRHPAGAVLAAAGTRMETLFVLRSGVAEAGTDDGAAAMRLAPGDCFGEAGLLTGAAEPASIRALTPVAIHAIPQAGLQHLLQTRPALAEELGRILAHRAARVRHPLEAAAAPGTPAALPRIIARIRHIFDLHHAPP